MRNAIDLKRASSLVVVIPAWDSGMGWFVAHLLRSALNGDWPPDPAVKSPCLDSFARNKLSLPRLLHAAIDA